MAFRHAIIESAGRGKQDVWLDSTVFASWSEYLAHLDAFDISPAWGERPSSQDEPRDWSGNVTYKQARELAEYGWPEGVQRMQSCIENARPYALRPQKRPQWEHTYAGFLPSMPAYVAGSPEHMLIRTQVDDPTRPVVRIVCSITASAGVDADYLLNRGAAILALVDYLESSGTRVEITLFDAGSEQCREARVRFESMIMLKRADEHVDIDRLAFALVHPAVLRKLQFKLREQCPELRLHHMFRNYGSIVNYTPEPDEVYLPAMFSGTGFRTAEDAMQTIIETATKALGERTFEQDDE